VVQSGLVSVSGTDPVVESYKRDVDRTLLEANLQLTVEQRWQKLSSLLRFLQEWRGAARKTAG
jgi:hypothetical protein